jgi:hypothetical protein
MVDPDGRWFFPQGLGTSAAAEASSGAVYSTLLYDPRMVRFAHILDPAINAAVSAAKAVMHARDAFGQWCAAHEVKCTIVIGLATRGSGRTRAVGGKSGLDDLAFRRSVAGLPDPGRGAPTLARLDVGAVSYYGLSAHGREVTLRVNPISRQHAETDVLQQLANAGGAKGASATLYVDHPGGLCAACGRNGAVKSMAQQAGISKLTVVTPNGTYTIP